MTPARGIVVAALVAATLAGCVRRPAPLPQAAPHYVVGPGYQAGGIWFYPREDFHYDATGLAAVDGAAPHMTADGEIWNGQAMVAAHPTLQLPAVVRVTNLANGLQALVRVNDRGPASPGRLIALSPKAAEVLGVSGPTPVRVQVEEGPSAALRDGVQGGPSLAVTAAPRGAVQAEALAPPPGIGQSNRGRGVSGAVAASAEAPAGRDAVPDRLPEVAQRVPVPAGRLMIVAGEFGQAVYGRQVAARLSGLGATMERRREGRSERYRVLAGPFPNAAAADAALDRALRAGVSDARIVVE